MNTKRVFKATPFLIGMAIGGAATAFLGWTVFLLMDGFSKDPDDGLHIAEMHESSNVQSKSEYEADSSMGSLKILHSLFHEGSRIAQSVQLFQLTEGRDEEFLLELARQAVLLPSVLDRDLTQSVVFRRLGAMDPDRALVLLGEFPNQDTHHMIRAIFQEWLHADMDTAIESAIAMSEPAKVAVLKEILNSRYDLSESALRDVAKKFDIGRRFDRWWTEHREFAFVADPESEWYSIVERNSKSASDTEELKRLANLWIQRDGVDVLIDISNSLPNGPVRHEVVAGSFRYAAKLDPRPVFQLANALPHVDNVSLASKVAFEWGISDPRAALEEISTIKEFGARTRFQESVARSWGIYEPEEMLENISLIHQSLRRDACSRAVERVLYSDPQESARLLEKVDDSQIKLYVARRIGNVWATSDADASLNWALSDEDIGKDLQTVGRILEKMAHNTPNLALEKALEQPITANSGVGAEAFVIASVSRNDPEEAISMLPKLREGSKELSYKLIADALIRNFNPERALELSADLAESKREEYLMFVFGHWVRNDNQGLLRKLEHLPADDSKFYAARVLDHYHSIHSHLSEEDLKSVKSILETGEFNEIPAMDLLQAAWPPYSVLSAQGL